MHNNADLVFASDKELCGVCQERVLLLDNRHDGLSLSCRPE